MEFKNIQQLEKEHNKKQMKCLTDSYIMKKDKWNEKHFEFCEADLINVKIETLKQVCEEIKELDIELFLEEVVDKKTGEKVEVPKEIRDLWDIYWEHIQDKLLKKFQGEEK